MRMTRYPTLCWTAEHLEVHTFTYNYCISNPNPKVFGGSDQKEEKMIQHE